MPEGATKHTETQPLWIMGFQGPSKSPDFVICLALHEMSTNWKGTVCLGLKVRLYCSDADFMQIQVEVLESKS